MMTFLRILYSRTDKLSYGSFRLKEPLFMHVIKIPLKGQTMSRLNISADISKTTNKAYFDESCAQKPSLHFFQEGNEKVCNPRFLIPH